MHNPPLIMIADDEIEISEVLDKICTRAGFKTTLTTDGIQTIAKAQEILPDLLLLDIQMPKLDGWGVLSALRGDDLTRQIPIIVITAAATKPEDAAQGIELGADDYIVKPFNYHELLARIRSKIRAKKLEESLQQRTEELEALVRLGVDLNNPLEFEPLAERLLLFLTEELDAATALVYFDNANHDPTLALRLDRNGELTAHKSTSQYPLHKFTDPEKSYLLETAEVSQLFQAEEIQTGIIAPIHHQQEQLGFLAVGSSEAGAFGDNELLVMSSVSKQAALAISNARLYEALRGYADELEKRVEARTAELKAAQEQLIRSEKLASLGRLSREIAHEINNPLQPIMTFLEDAIDDVENNRTLDTEGLRVAMAEVQRLKRTVARLLDFAKPDNSAVSTVDLHELMSETLTLTRHQFERSRIQLVTDLKEVPAIRASHDQIRQVFLNLIINASQAMTPKGGSLEVRLWHDQKYAHFTVKDEGGGISPEHLSLLFEPFFSNKKDGHGIGLAVSYSIIEAHGGKIDVQSDYGVGAEFKVSLPLI